MTGSHEKKKGASATAMRVVVALLLCGAAACIGYLAWQNAAIDRAVEEVENTPEPEVSVEAWHADQDAKSTDAPENPIDFPTLREENPDIYAWVYIPNTCVNLPVLQHPSQDNFYLDHNRYGAYSPEGAIYSQMVNAKDFSDPVTLLYGHNMAKDTMFSQLHYFENEKFFAQNEDMYIYTPGHILTYRIISAYQYDNRHIMNSYDFSDKEVLQSYFDFVADPDSLVVNVREGSALDASTDKIVQLSTCVGESVGSNRRYIVTGVLVDDQPTEQ